MTDENHVTIRLGKLEQHLKQENPLLLDVVKSFRELDRLSRRLGFFRRGQSHAVRVPWWPLISVLGVYSSGKSTFINNYLGVDLQTTGNQAVDDKFTVICFSKEKKVRVLPGLALNSDPRFPLFHISEAIEEVAPGEGSRVDAYLQLKACASDPLRGKIIIDSPGFDADAQRTSTLRITDHIIDLSDLVLVFFDARHPETGSMHDTLEHLVKGTIRRRDSNKFLYILNQIDATAQDDNPEEVFAAWQRALAQYGLTAGRYYTVYNPDVALPIQNAGIRERFEKKRDADLASIHGRLEQVGVERTYRIVGMLGQTAHMLEQEVVPRISRFVEAWRRRVLLVDGAVLAAALLVFFAVTVTGGFWNGIRLELPFMDTLGRYPEIRLGLIAVVILCAGYVHFSVRRWAAARVSGTILGEIDDTELKAHYARALRANSRWWKSIFNTRPIGWTARTTRRLARVIEEVNKFIQKLNDTYTSPSGEAPATQDDESLTPEEPFGPGQAEQDPSAAEQDLPVAPGTKREDV